MSRDFNIDHYKTVIRALEEASLKKDETVHDEREGLKKSSLEGSELIQAYIHAVALQQSNGDKEKELQIRDELNDAAPGSHARIKLAEAAAEEELLNAHREAISQCVSLYKELGMEEHDMDAEINTFIEKISTEESKNHGTTDAAQQELYESYKTTLLDYYDVVKYSDFEPASLMDAEIKAINALNAPAEEIHYRGTNSLFDLMYCQNEDDKAEEELLDAHKEAIRQCVSTLKEIGMEEYDMDAEIKAFIEGLNRRSVNHATTDAADEFPGMGM